MTQFLLPCGRAVISLSDYHDLLWYRMTVLATAEEDSVLVLDYRVF
jgi:hypothetical protein